LRSDHDPVWLLARIAFAVSTGAIVVGGSLLTSTSPRLEDPARVVGVSLGLTQFELVLAAVGLLPSLVFLLGVRSPWRILVFGALLLGINAAAWTSYALSRREALAGLALFMGIFWSLIGSIVGACMEWGARNDRAAAALGLRTEQRGPATQERPRAW